MDADKKFFGGLLETMKKALGTDETPESDETPEGDGEDDEVTLETLQKSIVAIGARLDKVEKPDETPEGDETPESKSDDVPLDAEAMAKGIIAAVTEAIKPIKESVDTHGEVLEKSLDRLGKLEGRTVVAKSASADEVESEGETKKVDPKEALFKSVQAAIKAEKKVVLT